MNSPPPVPPLPSRELLLAGANGPTPGLSGVQWNHRLLPRRRAGVGTAALSPAIVAAAACIAGLLAGSVHALIETSLTRSLVSSNMAGAVVAAGRSASSVGYGLCDERRCTAPEHRVVRRKPAAQPVTAPEILEAALVPRLGMKDQDLAKLPELQAYEQKEIVEDGVNLNKDNVPPEEQLKKRFKARRARRDKRNRTLRDLLDHVDDDPRKRARSVSDMVGTSDGEIDGEGSTRRPGNQYVKRIRRMLERDFNVPTHLSGETLSSLQVRIKVERMGTDGAILQYRIIKRSGNGAFDDAVLRLLLQFIPEEKGRKRLPVPDADVLRYINLKGLKIDLLGARLG